MVGVVKAAFGPGERDPNGPIERRRRQPRRRRDRAAATDPGVDRASGRSFLLCCSPRSTSSLVVFNLIPLLPLDGGHIAGALWEAMRRGVARLRAPARPGLGRRRQAAADRLRRGARC